MENIEKFISNLRCDISLDVQEDAIKKLLEIDEKDVEMLLQPFDKKYWENSAKVLKAIGYPKNRLAIPGMFIWLQDMNWPGAWIIMETLQNIDKNIMLPYLKDAIITAKKDDDEIWMIALKEFALNRLCITLSDLDSN